jgi:heme exporter protein B
MIKTLLFLIKIDCRLLYRELHEWLHPLIFYGMTLLLFPLAFKNDDAILTMVAPAAVWIAALFAMLLSIQHCFTHDLKDGYLQEAMCANVSLSLQIMAKFLAHWYMQILPLLVLTTILMPLFHLDIKSTLILNATLLLGTPIIYLLGIFATALTISLRQPGVLIGIILFPLIIPVIIFGINIVLQFNANLEIVGPMSFLAGLSILTITLFPSIISATLRLALILHNP